MKKPDTGWVQTVTFVVPVGLGHRARTASLYGGLTGLAAREPSVPTEGECGQILRGSTFVQPDLGDPVKELATNGLEGQHGFTSGLGCPKPARVEHHLDGGALWSNLDPTRVDRAEICGDAGDDERVIDAQHVGVDDDAVPAIVEHGHGLCDLRGNFALELIELRSLFLREAHCSSHLNRFLTWKGDTSVIHYSV